LDGHRSVSESRPRCRIYKYAHIWCEADGALKRIGVLTVRFFQKSSIFPLN
ncbi:maltose O-acetyltransferase, partial [Cryptococcus neoformans Tu401-1]